MKKWRDWWRAEGKYCAERRYVTLLKALLLAMLPLVCCLVYCGSQGRSLGEVYLPSSEWNDELFYYKQVESILKFGYPLGYYGFNESHALKLSFAAWSPVLVSPWILWGLVFGWNLMSPVICNIFLLMLTCFAFVWLVRPTWKQLGVLAFLFCLYTPFVRYMLSVMPEIICFSMVIAFFSLAINYLRRERTYKLVFLFAMSGMMTLMRPYLLLFLLLPCYLWIRRDRCHAFRWVGVAGSAAVLGVVLGLYACIKHFFGAEYFAPLFFTEWITAYFERGLIGGVRYTLGTLYYMGSDFLRYMVQGFRTGLASGAYFAGYLVCMAVLIVQSFRDWRRWKRLGRIQAPSEDGAEGKTRTEDVVGAEGKTRAEDMVQAQGKVRTEDRARAEGTAWTEDMARAQGKVRTKNRAQAEGLTRTQGNAQTEDNRLSEFQKAESGIMAERHLEKWGNRSKGVSENRVICGLEIPRGYDNMQEEGAPLQDVRAAEEERTSLGNRLIIQVHLAFSFVGMLFALLLMYKLTEGSKHLLTFMAAAIFIISLMETKFYKKAVLAGATFAYFFFYMALDPYDYAAPFVQEDRKAAVEACGEALETELILERENVPNYKNVVIWVFSDMVDGSSVNTSWQLLYALPEGFGISCCMRDYVVEEFDTLQSRYLVSPAGGEIDALCREAGYRRLYEDDETVFYERTR
jgi:hypothetical protein